MVRILGSSSTLDFVGFHMASLIQQAASRYFRKNHNNASPLNDVQARHTMQDIPKNGDPSPDTPPGIPLPTSPPDGVPRNILAFRTITKLLSLIQQEQAFRVNRENSLADDQQLALSTAFATIAVIDHEIVAVLTKITYEEIEVVCAAQTSIGDTSIEATPIEATPIEGRSIKSALMRSFAFIVTKNPRKDESRKDEPPIPQTGGPTISHVDDAGSVPGIDLNNNEILKVWVDERW
jgi:hypothetical protein